MYSLDDNWVFAVSVLAHRVARRVAGVLAETSALNLSQWRVLAADIGTPEQYAELKRVSRDMLEEWSRTKKAPRHAAWLHEIANAENAKKRAEDA